METRRSYRLDLTSDLTLGHDLQTLHGSVVNVGLSGIMGRTNFAPKVGEHYLLSFQLKPERTIFKSWAVVAWSQEHDQDDFLIGLQFERTDSAMYQKLADYISNRWITEHLTPGTFGSNS